MNASTGTADGTAWHTVAEAAQLTGTSARTMWRRIRAGEIPSRIGTDGRRMVAVRIEELTPTTTSLAAAATAASGAMRAADGLSDAIRIVEAQATALAARADQRAAEAEGRVHVLERSLARWRAVAVVVPVGVAVALAARGGPSPALADGTVARQVARQPHNSTPAATLWHPPMALPSGSDGPSTMPVEPAWTMPVQAAWTMPAQAAETKGSGTKGLPN